MYSPDDVARSIRRYVGAMLGPPWVIDLERRAVADDERPAGLIELGRAQVRRARTSIPQGEVELFAPLTVMLYPSLDKPRQAGRTARNLAFALEQLVVLGADGLVFADDRPASGPERIPLYDYSDVPLEGTAAEREGPEFPHDVLFVEDYGVNPVQDPQDPKRWSVALDCRVSWEQPGRAAPDAPITARMPPTLTVR